MPDHPGAPVRTALVTGATAGIGAAFARRLAATGHALVLVARDEQRLGATAQSLRAAYGVAVEELPADLSTVEGQDVAVARVGNPDRPIDLLVNNAGRSLNRDFLDTTEQDQTALLNLNVTAVLRLTLAAARQMAARGTGDIINVSSVAGFAPASPGSTYSATKAWVTNFTESVAGSLAPHGVRVMALCPGFVRTEFHARAGINMSKTPNLAWLDADRLVADALRDLRRGTVVSVPSLRYKAVVFGMRHLPRALLRRLADDTRGRRGHTEG